MWKICITSLSLYYQHWGPVYKQQAWAHLVCIHSGRIRNERGHRVKEAWKRCARESAHADTRNPETAKPPEKQRWLRATKNKLTSKRRRNRDNKIDSSTTDTATYWIMHAETKHQYRHGDYQGITTSQRSTTRAEQQNS